MPGAGSNTSHPVLPWQYSLRSMLLWVVPASWLMAMAHYAGVSAVIEAMVWGAVCGATVTSVGGLIWVPSVLPHFEATERTVTRNVFPWMFAHATWVGTTRSLIVVPVVTAALLLAILVVSVYRAVRWGKLKSRVRLSCNLEEMEAAGQADSTHVVLPGLLPLLPSAALGFSILPSWIPWMNDAAMMFMMAVMFWFVYLAECRGYAKQRQLAGEGEVGSDVVLEYFSTALRWKELSRALPRCCVIIALAAGRAVSIAYGWTFWTYLAVTLLPQAYFTPWLFVELLKSATRPERETNSWRLTRRGVWIGGQFVLWAQVHRITWASTPSPQLVMWIPNFVQTLPVLETDVHILRRALAIIAPQLCPRPGATGEVVGQAPLA